MDNKGLFNQTDMARAKEVLGCFVEEGFGVIPYPVLASSSIPEARVNVNGTEVFVEVIHMEWPTPEGDWKSEQGARLIQKYTGEVSQLSPSECGVVIMNPPTLIDEEVGKSILATSRIVCSYLK